MLLALIDVLALLAKQSGTGLVGELKWMTRTRTRATTSRCARPTPPWRPGDGWCGSRI